MYQIRNIRAGRIAEMRNNLMVVVRQLIDKGAMHKLAAYTEIPLTINKSDIEMPFVDPMEYLAEEAIGQVGELLKGKINFLTF